MFSLMHANRRFFFFCICLSFLLPVRSAADVIDVGVVKILAPTSEAVYTTPQKIQVSVMNFGSASITADKFIVHYKIDEGLFVEERFPKTLIPVGKEIPFSFAIPADLSIPGEHTIVAATVVPADENAANNATTLKIKSLVPPGGYRPPPTLPVDIGVVKILPPTGSSTFQAPQTIQVVVKNFANQNITADKFMVEYKLGESEFISERFASTPIPVGGEITLAFDAKLDLSKPGSYTITARTSLPADTNPSNNSASISLKLAEPDLKPKKKVKGS